MASEIKTPGLDASPMNIPTISIGSRKGELLVPNEQGHWAYFDLNDLVIVVS